MALFAYMWLLHAVLPVAPRPAAAVPRSALTIRRGHQVLWLGRATASAKGWSAIGLLVAALVLAPLSSSAALATLIASGWIAWSYESRVRIADDGLRVHRIVGWPIRTVPLAAIVRASSTYSEASVWHGWHRSLEDPDPRSLVIREGPTLVVESNDRLPLYVSVDHADEAADVLNALVARARSTQPATG